VSRGRTPKATEREPAALLTVAQAAALVGVRRETLWKWTRRGIFPRPRVVGADLNGRRRFLRREVLAWIEALPPAPAGPEAGA
jgi:excisionase family DNA binding protein